MRKFAKLGPVLVASLVVSHAAFAQTSNAADPLVCAERAKAAGKAGDLRFMQDCLRGSTTKLGGQYRSTIPDQNITKQLRDSSDSRNNR